MAKKIELTEEETEKFGDLLIKAFSLEVNENGRVVMFDWDLQTKKEIGNKTPLGVGLTVTRILNAAKREVEQTPIW